MQIKIEVAVGELFDRLTILEIKLKKISDDKLQHVQNDWNALRTSANKLYQWIDRQPDKRNKLSALRINLKNVNQDIWDIEDDIRDCERRQNFGDKFVQLARSVYITNDRRATIKKEISTLFGSDNMEEKAYTDYKSAPETAAEEPANKANPTAVNVQKCNQLVQEHVERNKKYYS